MAAVAALPWQARAETEAGRGTNGRVLLGVDYYPDQTPEALWAEDAQRMAAAGINNVRLAEFAWALMEPSEGAFRFDWLQRAVALLHAHGIDSILGTPSAAPPQWLSAKYPEVLLVNDQGVTMTPDSRRYTCPSNERYRELSARIAGEMARAFHATPGVIGWQIDNEYTLASFPRCYCRSCRAGFQQWLKAKYGSLNALNAAWGTTFWSLVYTDWAQIPTPLPTPAPPNPGFALDYDRYQSEANVQSLRNQVAVLRPLCPGQFLTTNNVGLADTINLRDLFAELDFASTDNYPGFFAVVISATPVPDVALAPSVSLGHDLMRGFKNGEPFLVMEEQSGKAGQPTFCPQPHPGQIRLWTYQAVAHGAMGINYFRWNTANFGAEEYWHGLLNHDRSESPAYAEIVQTFRELRALGPELLHAPLEHAIGLSFDPECDWATATQPGQPTLRYLPEVTSWYTALWDGRLGVDCVALDGDLGRYKVVFAPLQYMLRAEQAAGVRRFVEAGGTFVTGYRSCVKTEANQVVDVPRPGLLREVLGVTVADYVPVYRGAPGIEFAGAFASLPKATCQVWYDVLAPGAGTEVLATYADGDAVGRAAVTRSRHGGGHAYYIGPRLDAPALGRVLRQIAAEAGVQPTVEAPVGVEATVRGGGSRRTLFLLNHNASPEVVPLHGRYRDLLARGSTPGAQVTLPPYGVAVLREG